ncbi:MAG: ABC transporter ATP-binding protein [Leptospiraceae bacterium]|nr:ABC transporter ATP-binding protein [Leptospiraceae bacterium]
MLELINVNKNYTSSEHSLHVLKNISVKIEQGEFVAIMGPSGSGKSTLLGIAAGLDRADTGEVILDNVKMGNLSEDELAKLRAEKVGFIFQNFQLVRTLSAIENVSLPLIISTKLSEKEIKQRAMTLLEKVSLGNRITHFPSQLSGGEEQRVAIARSFINNPKILFADEPTGNLDSKNGNAVMDMLVTLNKQNNSTLIVVTHDPKVAALADRILEMENGEISATGKIRPTSKKVIVRNPSSKKKGKQ